MAGKKISELPLADSLVGAFMPIIQGGTNKKANHELFASESILIPLGDSTNIAVELTDKLDAIYTANLTGNGALTITGNDAGKYTAALLRISSSANGTNVLSPPAGVRWADGIAVSLAPTTGQTISLFIQSIDGVIVLATSSDRVPV